MCDLRVSDAITTPNEQLCCLYPPHIEFADEGTGAPTGSVVAGIRGSGNDIVAFNEV